MILESIFPINVYVIALAGAAVTSYFSCLYWQRWAIKNGYVDFPGNRKIHTTPIPLAGGLAILTGLILPLLGGLAAIYATRLGNNISALMRYGFEERFLQLSAIGAGSVAMTVVGLLDDKYELEPRIKFVCQFVVAALVAVSGVRITLFVPNLLFSYGITIFWILFVINALNFMDNMNGLCTGLSVIACWHFASSSASAGQYLVTLLVLVVLGACVGFLPHNFPKGAVFLGDSGSHLIGFLLAVVAILPHFYTLETPQSIAVLTPLFVLAVPLLDLFWVVLWRTRHGRAFYIGDTNHLSHRLVRKGLTPRMAVLLIWCGASVLGFLPQLWK